MTMPDIDLFVAFKSACEEKWARISIKDTVWGFQIQPQTRWNPGLTDEAIAQYQNAITIPFHPDLKTFLKCMNGTDIPAIDVRGTSGEPPRFAPGFYSYPRDLELVTARIEMVSHCKAQLTVTLAEQGFHLPVDAKLMPVYAHRYLVCSPSLDGSPVLSIWNDSDAIVYGQSLLDYLEREVLSEQ